MIRPPTPPEIRRSTPRPPAPDPRPAATFLPTAPPPPFLLPLLLPLLLAGVGPSGLRAQAPSAQNVPVVRLGAEDREPGAELEEVFRVGRAMGEDWEQFTRVGDVAFDGRGRLHLLDAGPNRVLVFGPEGEFLRELGGAGGGPGELLSPTAIAVTPDGEVVVHDSGRRSLVVYGPDGTHRRDVSLDTVGAFRLEDDRLEPDSTGGVLLVPFRIPGLQLQGGEMRMERGAAGGDPPPPALVRLALGEPAGADTLALGPAAAAPSLRGGPGGSGKRVTFTLTGPPTFAPELHWGPLPGGGAAVLDDTAYAVRILDASGRPLRELRRDLGPREVTAEMRERMRERRREAIAGGNVRIRMSGTTGSGVPELPASALERLVEGMTFAEVVPPVREFRTDPGGRIWVRRHAEDPSEAGPVDLLHADGRYLATLPPEAWPDALGPGGRAAYVEEDDLGIERVVVRRLPGSLR